MRNPARVAAEAATVASRYTTAIPAPGPVPTTPEKTPASSPCDHIAGSNTLSARGPAISVEMGMIAYAIMRLAENTRP